MALTRAQLISGDIANGAILAGQPQGVRSGGVGITIGTDGIISVNSQTIQGVMRLGPTPASAGAAFNGYTWPVGPGIAGQQLQTDGTGLLSWSNANSSPYTAKGQLVVGIGLGADVLLNVGSNTAALIADSSTASGLIYSNAVTSAMLAPAGTTVQRPNPAIPGQFRYNTLTGKFEFATGATSWEQVASGDPTVSGFVSQSIPSAPAGATGNALIPSGSTAQRQTSPVPPAGSTRYNTTTGKLEVLGAGGTWETLPSSTSGAFVGQTIPVAGQTASAVIPAGLTGERQSPALAGYIRFNTTTSLLEVFDGLVWTSVGTPPTAGLGINITGAVVKVSIPIQFGPPAAGALPAQAIDGSMYWDNTLGVMFIRYNDGSSTQWVQISPTGGGGGGGGSGTVTSVGITGTSGIGVVSGSPVTTSGSITLALDLATLPVLP